MEETRIKFDPSKESELRKVFNKYKLTLLTDIHSPGSGKVIGDRHNLQSVYSRSSIEGITFLIE